MPGIDSEPADREPGMVHLALQKRGLAGLGALLLANLQAFGERPLPRNFGLDPVRLLLAATGHPPRPAVSNSLVRSRGGTNTIRKVCGSSDASCLTSVRASFDT